MAEDGGTLGFGTTYGSVALRTVCGQAISLSHHCGEDRVPPHSHVNDYVCIVLAGGFAERRSGEWRDRQAGSYFTHRAGEIHQDRFGAAGGSSLNIHFEPGQAAPPAEGQCSATIKVAVNRLAFELAANMREELVIASLAAEIMADFHRPGGRAPDRGRWIDEIVDSIARDPGRRWTLSELADIAGRHPVHVAKSFREKTGISLGAFQRFRRLTSLSLALRQGHTPLAMLAADFGYCDQSHMTGEFRTAFGISPGRFRSRFH